MNDKPHVALDALLVRSEPTGVGHSILELVRALAASRRRVRFSVLVTAPEMFTGLVERPDWEVVDCPGARGGNLRKSLFTQFRLPGLVSDLGADLLHSLQYVAPLRLAVPSLVTVHDLTFLRFPETIEQPRRTYYRFMVPRSLNRAAAIVTNSRATAVDVIDHYPALAARVQVTPFGTPSWIVERQRAAEPPTEAYDRSEQARQRRPFLLFVGTLEPRKNLERLLAAYGRFRTQARVDSVPENEIPQLVLIGGRGWKDSALQAMISDLVAEGQLRVLDYCGTDDLYRYYRSAHGLLLPSLHEGFGFPILEAMAVGTPVLTADRGATAEVAGDAAVLVDPEDTDAIAAGIARLTWNAELRETLAAAGHKRAAAWSWQNTAEATLNVYDRILGAE